MKKTVFALFLTVSFFFPVAHADSESVTEMCKLEAASNEISGEDLQAYIDACVEETNNIRANGGTEKQDSAKAE